MAHAPIIKLMMSGVRDPRNTSQREASHRRPQRSTAPICDLIDILPAGRRSSRGPRGAVVSKIEARFLQRSSGARAAWNFRRRRYRDADTNADATLRRSSGPLGFFGRRRPGRGAAPGALSASWHRRIRYWSSCPSSCRSGTRSRPVHPSDAAACAESRSSAIPRPK